MRCRIKTRETVIGIDKSRDEANHITLPAGVVFEIGKDEGRGLFGLGFGEDCDGDDEH